LALVFRFLFFFNFWFPIYLKYVTFIIDTQPMDKKIFGDVDEYINELFDDQDSSLAAAEQSIKEFNIPPISISLNQGKFLHLLAKLNQSKKILEIGTLAGYSTIWLARALPPNGKLITLEYEALHAEVAKTNITRAGLGGLVDIRLGKAIDLLPVLAEKKEGPFDMIFIDADKPPYKEYFDWALKLSRPGTLIVADNVIREGKVLQTKSPDEMVAGVKRFNQALASNPAVTATIIQTIGAKEHDGMALAIVN
jgi:caffeoyl-CoA O-methyltransferase